MTYSLRVPPKLMCTASFMNQSEKQKVPEREAR